MLLGRWRPRRRDPDPREGRLAGVFRRGDDAVGNPHRAQIVQFEFFELIVLMELDKQSYIEQFEATASQSTVPSPRLGTATTRTGDPRPTWTILYYTILYYTILYYTILYYTILYYTILYYSTLY